MTEPQQTAAARLAALEWRWKAFEDLTSAEVYAMLAARSAVFVIEQNCLYGDIDGLDVDAWHLLAFGPSAGASPQADAGAQRGGQVRKQLRARSARSWPAICACCCPTPTTPTCASDAC